jgi:hypothetical protein
MLFGEVRFRLSRLERPEKLAVVEPVPEKSGSIRPAKQTEIDGFSLPTLDKVDHGGLL